MTFMLWFLMFLGVMFFSSGTIFFLTGARHISYKKDRDRQADREKALGAEMLKRWNEEVDKALIHGNGDGGDLVGILNDDPPEPVTEMDVVSAYPDEVSVQVPIYSNVSVSKEDVETAQPNMVDVVREEIRKAEIKEAQFEESGGRRNPVTKGWVNYSRAYWSDKIQKPTVFDDKLVYPTASEATDAALRTAHRLGMTEMFPKITNDYAIDIDVNRVIVEWVDGSNSGS